MNFGEINEQSLENTVFLGELSLDGKINKVNGVLPMCIEAKNLGMKRIIVPYENRKEASIVDGIEVLGIEHLKEVVKYLNNESNLQPEKSNIEELFKNSQKYALDFSEVKGQENIKRAIEVSAARRTQPTTNRKPTAHGKTMMARRIPSILPDLSFEEALEITKIHSIAGILSKETPIITERPFRSPHHTVSASSLVRGRKNSKTGRNKPSTLRSIIPRRITRIWKKHPRSAKRSIRRQACNHKQSKCKPNISM